MQFVFNMFNHNEMGQKSLEDVIGIFGHQLRALGHTAVWDKNNTKFVSPNSGVNIIVEGFTSGSIEVIARAHTQGGCRFLCLATEEPIEGKGFNHGKEREMRERMVTFPEAMKYFEGILYLVPGDHVQKWYGQFRPAAYVDLGFAPTLVRATRQVPIYDFGFYGSLTERRHQILKRLAKKMGTPNAIRVVADFKTQEERDAAMREARVIVQVRKYKEMGLVSSSRCNTALMLGRPVLAEPHDLCKPWDEVIKFSKTIDDFYSDAIAMRLSWQSVWMRQFENFRKAFSPERCAGEPLERIGFKLAHAA